MIELENENKNLLNKKTKFNPKISGLKRSQIQDQICRALEHVFLHGNHTPLSQLLNNCNSEITKKRIIRWIELFSPFEVQVKAPYKLFKKDKGFLEFDKALVTPFWTLVSPENKKKDTPASSVKKSITSFLSDPSEQNYLTAIDNMKFYKNFASNPTKRALSRKPNNIVQGGSPSLR